MSKSNGTPLPPNTTLYVKNFPNKINKVEVRRQLYSLFVGYGKILDVVATKANGMGGQAFIVFRDLASSTAALRALDGFIFYDKPLSIDYAQSRSKASIIAERGPEALFDPDLLESTKKNGGSNKQKITFSSAGAELKGRERKRAREEAGVKVAHSDDGSEGEDDAAGVQGEGQEEEEEDDDDDKRPELKKPKIDNGPEDDEEEEMQMADSDED